MICEKGSAALAETYRGGTLFLLRLTVCHYHHYCYVADGTEGPRTRLPGRLYSVLPLAAEKRPIYRENIREYSILHTAAFGPVLTMEVGAMMVGRIVSHAPGGAVCRGQEKGYFEFGGSSILLGFAPGEITPDADLLRNSREGFETAVRQGERIAVGAGETAPLGFRILTINYAERITRHTEKSNKKNNREHNIKRLTNPGRPDIIRRSKGEDGQE